MMAQHAKALVCLESEQREGDFLTAAADAVAKLGVREVVVALATDSDTVMAGLAAQYTGLRPSVASMQRFLEEQTRSFFHAPEGVTVRCEAREGNEVIAMARLALDEDVDVIIVERGQHEPDRAGRVLARRLAFKCACSLLMLPGGRKLDLARVLVPVRDSPCSVRALQTAVTLAGQVEDHPEVIAHHVYRLTAGYQRVGLSYEDFSAELRAAAEQEYRAIVQRIEAGKVRILPLFTEDPHDQPARIIQSAVVDQGVGSVFIGSRGRSGVAGLILGHVTETLIATCPAPVFAVREKGENLGILQAMGLLRVSSSG